MKKLLFLLLALAISISSCASGETNRLPINLDPLTPPPEECFISDNEYKDETLHVRIEQRQYLDSLAYVAWVNIADPSQLRTGLSSTKENILCSTPRMRTTTEMAKRAGGAVIAINGDWFASEDRSYGYIVRMGEVLREKDTAVRDSLLIDDQGNFHLLVSPEKEDREAVTAQYNIVNALSFGPAMIIDGKPVDIREDYPFESQWDSPRTAIGQIGELSYVMIVVDGRLKHSPGLTLWELRDFMLELGCQQAFALDGGGTSTMSFHFRTVNRPAYGEERHLSDIVYFASGLSEPAQ